MSGMAKKSSMGLEHSDNDGGGDLQAGTQVIDSRRGSPKSSKFSTINYRKNNSTMPAIPYTERLQLQKQEEENIRVMRAFNKHQIHQMHWDRTTDTIRHLRKNLVIRDCREKDKIGSKHFNLRKNPASIRSLVEI